MNKQAPAIYTDKARQLRGLISFHDRAAKAYRHAGNTKQAERAEAMREDLIKQLDQLTPKGQTA